ncbi:hypothetical protein H2203_002632 [Taxawa tesnikishii (nom. ined.)]|nr:hypothetical protein H2203_002632 [Dothideales sp. JES 119]
MGGFVQSAMLKRTDSVNKRWSAQPGASLSRQNSTASVMSGYGGLRDGLPGIGASRTMPDLNGQATLRQDNSTEPNSRPGSSHSTISNLTLTQEPNVKDRFARPALPHAHSRSKSVASLRDPPLLETSAEGENPISPPLSPSKRFSIRSRSPTKSSWLESALARPDSPQLKPATSTQPEWMANINKTKQQRNSAESTGSQGASDAEIMTATAKSLSAKPVKVTPKEPVAFGQSVLKRSPSKDLSNDPKRSITPPTKPKPLISQTLPKTPVLEQGPADVEKPPQVDVEDRGAKSPAAGLSPSISHSAKSSITSPSLSLTSPKPKPETPPKKDFRANLKPRQINVEASKSDEPEFKNVFGKLKKTQTEKYMAPDELKNNILRGKSGLTVTGGPQKTERRDELKESLLQKKEEMKAKAAEGGSEHQRSLSSVKTEAPALPEALQIKKQLGRSDSLKPSNAPANARRDVTPEALSLHRTLRGKPKLEHPQTGDRSPVEQEKKEPPLENTKSPSETEKQEPLHKVATFPLTHEEASQPLSRAPSDASLKKVSSASEAEGKSTPVSNKFADRFNPGLAGLLARGPPPQASQSNTPRSVSPAGAAVAGCPAASDETGEGVTLTHMTKSRAKGPKRRKPGTKESNPEPGLVKTATVPTGIKVEKRISAQLVKSNNFSPSSPTTKMPLQPAPKSAAVRAVSLSMSPAPAEKEKPITPTKSSSLSLKASPKLASKEEQTSQPPSPGMPAPSSVARKDSSQVRRFPTESAKSAASIDAATATPSTDSLAVKSLKATEPSDANKENANSSVKNVAALWGKSVPKLEPQKRGSPIPLPTKKDEEAAMKAAGLLSTSPMRYKGSPVLGLGISSKELPKPPGRVATPTGSAGLPPKPPTKSSRVVSGALQERFGSKGRRLAVMFGELPISNSHLDIDTQAVLAARQDDTSITKTLRKTIQEISGDGKLTPLPAQEEHVLYESCMYICTHIFGSATGARMTEVYLWAGAGVPESSIEDAQLFGKRVAKEAGGGQRFPSLLIIRQSREPPAFFQALGGIVITRRGSRADASTRPYMLCGRPHMGHIAFDEETKLFLWKGAAAGAEAIGSARLIGMDLNPTGEITEVDEGKEPRAFHAVFPTNAHRSLSAGNDSDDFWKTNARMGTKRPGVLLAHVAALTPSLVEWREVANATLKLGIERVKPECRPGSAEDDGEEIAPFTQLDLEPEGCFVLDAGAEVLVLPGPLLPTQAHAAHMFTQALLFAHDYAILSASLEDRPAIPKASVALDGFPGGLKLLFRSWDERRGVWGPGALMAGRKKVEGEMCRRVGVQEALEECCVR